MVRMDDRGLAHLTQEFARHMGPERVLAVDVMNPRFPIRPLDPDVIGESEVFDATFVDGYLGGQVSEFLAGLTHVYTAETPYDPFFFERCRARGVATICHVMPEFDRFTGAEPKWRPSAVWLPTAWRAELVEHSTVVPVPAPVAPRPRLRSEAKVFGHVIGSGARPDRAGSLAVYDAIRRGPSDVEWILFAQDADRGIPEQLHGCRNVRVRLGSVADRFELFDDIDVLVAPRRWGGLSLPVLEACASGVPVVMLDVDPMGEFAAARVQSRYSGQFDAPGGTIEMFEADRDALVATVIDYAKGGVDVMEWSAHAGRMAGLYGWPRWAGQYWSAIGRVTL